MNREIKFRAWHKVEQKMYDEGWMIESSSPKSDGAFEGGYFGDWDTLGADPDETERAGRAYVKADDLVLMQFTGVKDKSGAEIYFGDLLEVKFAAFDDKLQYHAIYEVVDSWGGGFKLHLRKLFTPEETFYFITLDTSRLREDYANQHFDHLALVEDGPDWLNGSRHKKNAYSNEFVIVGNIHKNPELLNGVVRESETKS